MTLSLRIPAWAEHTEVRIGSEMFYPAAGTYCEMRGRWRKYTEIQIDFHTDVYKRQSLQGPFFYPLSPLHCPLLIRRFNPRRRFPDTQASEHLLHMTHVHSLRHVDQYQPLSRIYLHPPVPVSYTHLSDPRAEIFKRFVKKLSDEKDVYKRQGFLRKADRRRRNACGKADRHPAESRRLKFSGILRCV